MKFSPIEAFTTVVMEGGTLKMFPGMTRRSVVPTVFPDCLFVSQASAFNLMTAWTMLRR